MKPEIKTQHTPTPWEVMHMTGGTWKIARPDDSFEAIARTWSEANAAFIVRSTNNFENMLSTLKYVVDSGESYERVQEVAEQAIAKAEGK